MVILGDCEQIRDYRGFDYKVQHAIYNTLLLTGCDKQVNCHDTNQNSNNL